MKILWLITVNAALIKPICVLGDGPAVQKLTTETTTTVTYGATSCPESGVEIDGICNWEISNPSDWHEARKRCQNYAGDLVNYQNATEEGSVMRKAARTKEKTWIGLRRDPNSSVFRWTDGSNLTYTNWAPEEPRANDSIKLCVASGGQNSKWEVTDCTLQHPFICKAAKGICGGEIHSDNGNFRSPNFPKSYTPNLRCTWQITVPEGQVVILQFLSFDLEDDAQCKLDYVKVVDGHESNSSVLNTLCGGRNLGIIQSSGNKMSVNFVTDDDYVAQFQGFSAAFTTGTPCSERKTSSNLNWWHYQNYCYTVYERKTYDWYNAKSFCHNNGAFLASIHSMEEQRFLHSLHLKPINSWIGLNAASINSTYNWVDGTTFEFQNWGTGEEDRNDTDTCTYLDVSTGFWRKRKCFEKLPAVCKFKENPVYSLTTVSSTPGSQGLCSDQWHTFGNKCYQLFGSQSSGRKTWRDANQSCADAGSTLVSIHSKEEQEFLKVNVSTVHTEIWIGMYYLAAEKLFYWVDSSTFDFTDWDSNEPSYDGEQMQCVNMNYTDSGIGGWKTDACNSWFPHVCQITKGELCTNETCKNGGNCTEDGNGGLSCTCQHGYKGLRCEENELCTKETCKNFGNCTLDSKGSILCTCQHGYKGLKCEEKIICAENACKNGGSCTQDVIKGIFRCSCGHGYKGLTCAEDAIPKHSDINHTGLELSLGLGIPLVVVCSILLFLLVRRIRRRKKPHDYLIEQHIEFTNPQTMCNFGMDAKEDTESL